MHKLAGALLHKVHKCASPSLTEDELDTPVYNLLIIPSFCFLSQPVPVLLVSRLPSCVRATNPNSSPPALTKHWSIFREGFT